MTEHFLDYIVLETDRCDVFHHHLDVFHTLGTVALDRFDAEVQVFAGDDSHEDVILELLS